MLSDLGTNSGNSEIPEFRKSQDTFVQFQIPSSGKNMFYRTLCAAGYPPGISGKIRDIFGHFFRKCHNSKNAKMPKNKKKKRPENTRNFGCFIENRAVAICRSIEKVSKMTPKIPMHTCTLSKFPRGAFSGFSGLST
jgi:hypothetical protein